jgi:hypothetical protein
MRSVKKPKKKTARAVKRSSSTKRAKPAKAKRSSAAKLKRRNPPKTKRKAAVKRKAPVRRKVAAKPKVALKPKRAARKTPARPKPAPAPAPRRDATGHLNPKYAADLRARSKESTPPPDADSFVKKSKSSDPLAEELGEGFVRTAVSGEDTLEEASDEVTTEESGGPFLDSPAQTEFAQGTDASNPKDAEKEPFPTT